MKSFSSRHIKATTDSTCVSCKKVRRLICSEGPKWCFEGFVSKRIASESIFGRYQDFVLFSRQFVRKVVDALLESSEQNARLSACKICNSCNVLQSLISFDRTIPNHNIQSWSPVGRSLPPYSAISIV